MTTHIPQRSRFPNKGGAGKHIASFPSPRQLVESQLPPLPILIVPPEPPETGLAVRRRQQEHPRPEQEDA